MRMLIQVLVLLLAATIGGVVGALLVRPAASPIAAGPGESVTSTPAGADPVRFEVRLRRLEEEAFQPRLVGMGIDVRLEALEERIRNLEQGAQPTVPSPGDTRVERGAPEIPAPTGQDSTSLDEVIARARGMAVSKQNAEARLSLWLDVIGRNPSDDVLIEAWEGAAWAYSALRRYPEAVNAYQEIVRIAGADTETALQASLRLALAQADGGEGAAARATLESLATSRTVRQPLVTHAWFQLANLAEEAGDLAAARRAYQWVVDENRGADLPVLQHLAEQAQLRLDALK